MNGITEWTAIGTTEHPFSGKFNGKGHTIRNIAWTADAAKSTAHGLFGVLNQASVRNLTVGGSGDRIIVRGTAAAGTAIAGVAAFATESVIENVANNVSISFEGEDPADTPVMLAGIVGQMSGTTLGGQSAEAGCTNNGDLTSGASANTGNGGKGMQGSRHCAVHKNTDGNFMGHAPTTGRVNAPSGRGGGAGREPSRREPSPTRRTPDSSKTTQSDSTPDRRTNTASNAWAVWSEVRPRRSASSRTVPIPETSSRTSAAVRADSWGTMPARSAPARTPAPSSGNVTVAGSDYHGPGWACGYNKSASLISDCIGHGFVGDYDTYKDSPTTAPAAMHTSAVCHKRSNYDTEENTVDWTLPSYYDWELKQTVALHPGVKYTYYEFTNLPRKMHVLELDLTNDAVEISTSMADDLVPNPNGNNNSNNGKNIRETLSENCNRKRAEGQNIIAGINSGFFNSHDGFPRGLHIEEGRPDFVNNKSVRTSLTNHANAFTFFKDRTVSCGKKTFSGKIEVGGTEYEYHSINDTILRSGSTLQEANLYTARYKKIPHPDAPSLTNTLSKKALYVVAKNKSGNPVTVNDGWFEATVTQIADGRSTELAEAPYLTALDEWAVQLTGATAETLAGKLSVGSTLRIRADVTVNGISTPILTQNSTMYQFMVDGEDKSFDTDKYDPMTYVGIDKAGTKVCFFVIDGRQDWISMGVKFYEMVRIAQKFDCWNVTRFDGGGSTAMWLYTDGAGKVVNQPSDAKGERSCMNYLHVRIKQ